MRGNDEARALAAASLVTVASWLPVFLVGTLAVEMKASLHFGTTAFGLAVTLYYLGGAGFSVPVGRLSDWVGAVRVMRVATICNAVLLALLAFVTRSWLGLALLLVPCGMVNAATSAATNQFLSRRMSVLRQGRAFGFKQAAVPFASLLGGLSVPAIALTVGWRWAFALGVVIALAAGLLVPAPRTTLAARGDARQLNPPEPVVLVPLVFLAFALGLGLFAAGGLSAFLMSGGVAIGLAQGNVGLLAALAGAVAVSTRIAVGYRSDRHDSHHFRTVALMLAAGSGGFVLLAIGSSTSAPWAFASGAVLSLGVGWGWNGVFNLAVVRAHEHAPSTATGVTQVGGSAGGMAGPFVVGVVASHVSYLAAWLIAGVAALAAAAAVLVAGRLLAARDMLVVPSA